MKRKILLIDDSGANQKLIQDLLTTTNLELIEARNSQQAVEMAVSEHPSLIMMAMEMSVMNGREMFAFLRHNPATCNIPIIALTSHSTEEGKPAGFSIAGFKGLSAQPVQLQKLVAKIQPYVNVSRLMAAKERFQGKH